MEPSSLTPVIEGLLAAAGELATVDSIGHAHVHTIVILRDGRKEFRTHESGIRVSLTRPLASKMAFRHHVDQSGLQLDLRIDAGGAGFCLYPLVHGLPFQAPEVP